MPLLTDQSRGKTFRPAAVSKTFLDRLYGKMEVLRRSKDNFFFLNKKEKEKKLNGIKRNYRI